MNLMGMDVGECRPPLVGMEAEQIEKLAAYMRAVGLIA